jgi:hypothetical protein
MSSTEQKKEIRIFAANQGNQEQLQKSSTHQVAKQAAESHQPEGLID